ncbi:hypothetical protein FHX37_2648 [Haloactinospora alba]|uniref:PKD domain-containing protein n=1 Tax=Haloactinospora alba TaxID=405555 RepID=A0A543NLG4_9ACTN|nr:hypothetical protein [Haloactinospora alba]TQN32671.1 hypothetical protein FHX37_2648 [Haloactinospora alba]
MLKPGRGIVTLGVTAAVLALPLPAWADPDFFEGNAECDETGCEASAESGESSQPEPPSDGGEVNAGTGQETSEPDPTCEEVDGMTQECETTIPAAQDAETDPAAAADTARDSLRLPTPGLASSPAADQNLLVQVPVWLWLDEESWRPYSAEAEVDGGAVSVTAEPTRALWDMGDGETVKCDGGVAYVPAKHDPEQSSPECGHTYTRSSINETRGTYALEVEVVWQVSWEGPGGGGELDPLVTSQSTEVTVVESHGLVTGVE